MHRQGSLELRVVRASMGFLLTNRGKGSDVRERGKHGEGGRGAGEGDGLIEVVDGDEASGARRSGAPVLIELMDEGGSSARSLDREEELRALGAEGDLLPWIEQVKSCNAGWAGTQIEGGRWCCGLARLEWIGKVEAGWVAEETEEDLE